MERTTLANWREELDLLRNPATSYLETLTLNDLWDQSMKDEQSNFLDDFEDDEIEFNYPDVNRDVLEA